MKRIEDRIAYTFKDKELLKVALTHSSHSGTTTNNERLEFLGGCSIGTDYQRVFV